MTRSMTGLLLALALTPTGGCDEAFSSGGSATVTPMYATITARDLRGLEDGETLAIELDGAYPTVFEFDGRSGSIDFSRLEITAPGETSMSMRLWLARQVAAHGVDLEALPSRRFRLSNDRQAGVAGLQEAGDAPPTQSVFRSCSAIDVVELDAVVAVLFVDGGC